MVDFLNDSEFLIPKNEDQKIPEIVNYREDFMENDDDEQKKFYMGYGNWKHVIKKHDRSILNDLKNYPFPEEIKNKADVIYNKMIYRVRRGKIRTQLLFFCVLCAFFELERDVNPIYLGEVFKLTPGQVQQCDSIFSPLQTGYRPKPKYISPLHYLPDYCDRMGLSETSVTEISDLASSILKKQPALCQENPQTVASGLLRYFTITNGIDNLDKIVEITRRSAVTIENMYKTIAIVDNS
jgi:transcription initiation factor TFIIIB Brf1 subunit/transcription initiation factor TFIIB